MSRTSKRHFHKKSMPLRPRQHEIDTEAINFIMSKLPSRWTREEIKNDYGKDLFVEIFENGEATALEFRIQSKGHEKFLIRHKDKAIQPIEISKLNYYDQLPLPILLIIYSCQTKEARYLWIKPYIRQILDKENPSWRELNGDSEISIRIPLTNIFDETTSIAILKHVESEISKIRLLSTSDYQVHDQSRQTQKEFSSSSRVIRPRINTYLHRPRLTSIISSSLSTQSVFIRASAGYGKTWLLQDFINSTNPPNYIWYCFNKDTLEGSRFVGELATEFIRQTGIIGKDTFELIQEKGKGLRADDGIIALINEVVSASNIPILIILEDIHNCNNFEIQSAIDILLMTCPRNLQIIITSRLPLPTNQAKLTLQAKLFTIEQLELEFDESEICEYLKSIHNLDLSPEQVQLLDNRTNGWIAAISLAASALRVKSIPAEKLFEQLTGFKGNIYDFFAEEVYQSLPSEIKNILKRLSIARAIQGGVVNLFTGNMDGGQFLKDISRQNTFLIEIFEKEGIYKIHPLFAEFLTTRFKNEEGIDAIREAHRILANHFYIHRDWIFAVEHAIDSEEWNIAIQSLEILGPIGVSLGYGFTFLDWIRKIPEACRQNSAILCESIGLSGLQVGDLYFAEREFEKAKGLYSDQEDSGALNRIEYYLADVKLTNGEITPEDFLRITYKVASWSYQHNEILFGSQVELRLIQVGQTIAQKYSNLLQELLSRSETLVTKLEGLGTNYDLIRAKVLASQAHLIMQIVTFGFNHDVNNVLLREKVGHPIELDERVDQAKTIIRGFDIVFGLYSEAEKILYEKSEIEWALIRASHMQDFAHYLSQVFLVGSVRSETTSNESQEMSEQTQKTLISILVETDKCIQIFSKYQLTYALAKTFCDAADVYDILRDLDNRDRLAKEAREIAKERRFIEIQLRADNILKNKDTFTALLQSTKKDFSDQDLVKLDESGKSAFVNTFLCIFQDSPDINKIRLAITSDVDDMIDAAKQRIEWCRHIQIIQNLEHTRGIDTMYRSVPDKWIICQELGHQSLNPGKSFMELFGMFKGVYCLGCKNRSLLQK